MRVSSAGALRARLRRYLRDRQMPDRRRLGLDVLPRFGELGSIAIIGGMLRDIARQGARGYASDIDLVVDPLDPAAFREALIAMGGRENRFGGFGLELASWRVDVWALPDTWARTAGHREVNSFPDLLHCTFFDWDAIVYDLGRGRLLTRHGYFETLASGVLGLNLEANPNERGSAVRAIRKAVAWNARFSAPLADYVLAAEARHGWTDLATLDRTAFASPVLDGLHRDSLLGRMRARVRDEAGWVSEPIRPSSDQRLML